MNFFVQGILIPKGGMHMRTKTILATMGLGAAAGAVAILMMPRNNPTRQFAQKTANKVEHAAMKVGDKLSQDTTM